MEDSCYARAQAPTRYDSTSSSVVLDQDSGSSSDPFAMGRSRPQGQAQACCDSKFVGIAALAALAALVSPAQQHPLGQLGELEALTSWRWVLLSLSLSVAVQVEAIGEEATGEEVEEEAAC